MNRNPVLMQSRSCTHLPFAAAIVFLALVLAAIDRSTGRAPGAGRSVTLTIKDAGPVKAPVIRIKPGDTVSFTVRNKSSSRYDIAIRADRDWRPEPPSGAFSGESPAPFALRAESGHVARFDWHFHRPGTFLVVCVGLGHGRTVVTARVIVFAVPSDIQ